VLGLDPDDLPAGTNYSFVQLAKELRNSHYPVFQIQLQKFGETWQKRG
jgi:hypothetical protein